MINKVYVLLPVYNEGESIHNLLEIFDNFFKSLCTINHEIIIVNDFSSDDSENWILGAKNKYLNLNINYIKHENNKGLQGSLSTGFSCLKDISENDILISMDGDNTHNPFLIREMIDKINEGADIVIASRYCEQSRISGLSRSRTFLSIGARYLYSLMWNIPGVKDYTCGFRAYKGWLVRKTLYHYGENFIQEKGFTATAEVLQKMSTFKPVIVEVPMILKYSNKLQTSNMRILKTIKLTLQMLFRYSF